jgi:exodeoxyribonuclease VII small subunit
MSKEEKFEQALKRLEKIVDELESGELDLDQMIKKYKEGSQLITRCQVQLEKAEQQIKILTQKENGSITSETFDESM